MNDEITYWASKTAVITGAAIGIGFEIAKQLCQRGVHIVLNDIDADALDEAQISIGKSSSECLVVTGDSSDLDCIDEMIKSAITSFGQIDFVIANSGITTYGPFLEYSVEDFQKITKVNLQGTFFLTQAAAKQMIKQKSGGRIVLMSSVTGHTYHPDLTAYGMTKAGIILLAKSLGVDLAKYGIKVYSISPGATITERTAELEDGNFMEMWYKIIPIGECATTEQIAHTALFLLSEKSAYITGQTIIVDGGWTAYSPPPY